MYCGWHASKAKLKSLCQFLRTKSFALLTKLTNANYSEYLNIHLMSADSINTKTLTNTKASISFSWLSLSELGGEFYKGRLLDEYQ